MRAKILGLVLLFSFALTGCTMPLSLSERAIVKAVYVDVAEEGYVAALAVFTCEPSTDIASVTGDAKVCVGRGESVEMALYNAQMKQNKKPFYAHNRILLIGPRAMTGGARDVLQQFSQSENARQQIGVFFTGISIEEFEQQTDNMEQLVRETERILDQKSENRSVSLLSPQIAQGDGLFPVMEITAEEKTVSASVDHLAVLQSGKIQAVLQDNALQLALVLSQNSNRLTLTFQQDGKQYIIKTQDLFLQRETTGEKDTLQLTVSLQGSVQTVSGNGAQLHGAELEQVVQEANRLLEKEFLTLHAQTFLQQNDVFSFAWYLKQADAAAVEALRQGRNFYTGNRVVFSSAMRAQ